MPRRTPTRADQLRRALEEDIFAGTLKPGDRLDEQSLAHRFQVSRTPVREALRQLSASGLVEVRPRQGAVVSVITLPRLVEMFEVMAELEAMCARLAARRMSDKERADLKRFVEECEEFEKKTDLEGYYAANKVFHDAIYDGSHNEVLADMTARFIGVPRPIGVISSTGPVASTRAWPNTRKWWTPSLLTTRTRPAASWRGTSTCRATSSLTSFPPCPPDTSHDFGVRLTGWSSFFDPRQESRPRGIKTP